MWGPILFLTFLGLEAGGKMYAYWEREIKWLAAQNYSIASKKPILNIGSGDQPRYIGDVNIDIINSILPNFTRHDLGKKLPFEDKTFGSAIAFHVLEHVDDPKFVLGELNRVADRVFIALPPFWEPTTYLSPDHKWAFIEGRAYQISGAGNTVIIGALLTGVGLMWIS